MTTIIVNGEPRELDPGASGTLLAVAPAIGNAIFAATGRRLRALPLIPGPTAG